MKYEQFLEIYNAGPKAAYEFQEYRREALAFMYDFQVPLK